MREIENSFRKEPVIKSSETEIEITTEKVTIEKNSRKLSLTELLLELETQDAVIAGEQVRKQKSIEDHDKNIQFATEQKEAIQAMIDEARALGVKEDHAVETPEST